MTSSLYSWEKQNIVWYVNKPGEVFFCIPKSHPFPIEVEDSINTIVFHKYNYNIHKFLNSVATLSNTCFVPTYLLWIPLRRLDDELCLNELQILSLQQRINHRNRAKLANTTTIDVVARLGHELVYCSNNYSWKITANVNQQSILQRCQFPCIVSKAVLWKYKQSRMLVWIHSYTLTR